jgi:hypothetical protein
MERVTMQISHLFQPVRAPRAGLLCTIASVGMLACHVDDPHFVLPYDAAADASAPGPDAAIDGPPGTYHVGGSVDGMWDGGAVALRLQATGIDDIKAVASNSGFNFDAVVPDGLSYVVTVETPPEHHSCDVANGVGMVAGADVTSIAVTCTGPDVDMALGAPIDWTFDPATMSYALQTSVLTQATTVRVTSPLATSIDLGAESLASGVPSLPVSLALGPNALSVLIIADSVSREYAINVDRGATVIEQAIYGKSSNSEATDNVGASVAASGDTIVVGATGEDSGSAGVNGPQGNNAVSSAGAVFVFRRTSGVWAQEAYIKASNPGASDTFGNSVSVSGDFLAVGAQQEASNAVGPYSNQTDNSAASAGAVYIFQRSGTTWTQDAYLKASNTDAADFFGSSVAIDGDTLAVGARLESSAATGINGTQSSNAAPGAGAVYVFRRTGGTWAQEAYIKASNTNANDVFGGSVALDSGTLVVGAVGEASAATGVGGNQSDNSASNAGAAYVFTRSGSTWSQQAYIKASNTDAGDIFGSSVAVSGDTLAVGAQKEQSGATGIGGDQSNDAAASAGAAYVFTRSGTTWTQQAYVKASNTDPGDEFGAHVALRGDALAVGSWKESSGASGIDGNQLDNAASQAGACYVFTRTGSTWTQAAYVKASNPDQTDNFGGSAALFEDGLMVGAKLEDGSGQGLASDDSTNGASGSGAFYVFQ